MGIEGRDYYRDSSRYTETLTGWGWDAIPPVCKWLLIINVVVFLLQIFVTRSARPADLQALLRQYTEQDVELPEGDLPSLSFLPRISVVQEWLQLETRKVLHGQVWRLLTSAFCHDRTAIWHLLFNMLFLYWFGLTLESMYGSREFLLFYLSAAIVASLAYVGLDLLTGESLPAIGASGAVMAVTMLYAIHYPRSVIYIMFVIPVEVRWLVVLYVIFDLHPVLLALAGDHMVTGIAHAAHLGGLAFGFLYWRFDLRLAPLMDRLRMPRWNRLFGPRREFQVFRPTRDDVEDDVDAQVDDILRKIRDQGEASLSRREQEILISASRRYQNRKK
jgi:membrane associated rhomboid family serine protease